MERKGLPGRIIVGLLVSWIALLEIDNDSAERASSREVGLTVSLISPSPFQACSFSLWCHLLPLPLSGSDGACRLCSSRRSKHLQVWSFESPFLVGGTKGARSARAEKAQARVFQRVPSRPASLESSWGRVSSNSRLWGHPRLLGQKHPGICI